MDFEYDPAKSETNEIKHGIAFGRARALWKDPRRVEFTARFEDEDRSGLIAELDSKLWTAVFTNRDGKTRIISVRRARNYEKKLYYSS